MLECGGGREVLSWAATGEGISVSSYRLGITGRLGKVRPSWGGRYSGRAEWFEDSRLHCGLEVARCLRPPELPELQDCVRCLNYCQKQHDSCEPVGRSLLLQHRFAQSPHGFYFCALTTKAQLGLVSQGIIRHLLPVHLHWMVLFLLREYLIVYQTGF